MRVLSLKDDKDVYTLSGTQLPPPKNTAHPVNQQYVVSTPRITKKAVAEESVGVARAKESTYDQIKKQVATMKRLQESAQAIAQMRISETSALIERADLFGQQAEPIREALIPITEILQKVADGVLLTKKELATLKAQVPDLPEEPTEEDESEQSDVSEPEPEPDNLPPLEPEEEQLPEPEPVPQDDAALLEEVFRRSTIGNKAYYGSGDGPNLGRNRERQITLAKQRVRLTTSAGGNVVVSLGTSNYIVDTPGKAILLISTPAGINKNQNAIREDDIKEYNEFITSTGLRSLPLFTYKIKATEELKRKLTGAGIRKTRKPPKSAAGRADALGHLGGVKINLHMLGTGVLELTDAKGKIVMRRPATKGLAHLLTHRGSMAGAGTKYTERDLHDFHEIADMAGVNVPSHTAKARALLPGVKEAIFLPKDVPTLEARLVVLRGERGAGNASQALVNEALVIADMLLKKRALSKREHEVVFREMVM
jgi:hypothetical protein